MATPVAKVTILPAGQALGVPEQLPESERHLNPKSYLHESLAVRLGGRAAEILVLGEPSTGAPNDLAGATQRATHMARDWGMSPELGPVGLSLEKRPSTASRSTPPSTPTHHPTRTTRSAHFQRAPTQEPNPDHFFPDGWITPVRGPPTALVCRPVPGRCYHSAPVGPFEPREPPIRPRSP
jgi:hypothetical protein